MRPTKARPSVEEIRSASHLRLRDGWVEVIAVRSIDLRVGNGSNPAQTIRFSEVLEVRKAVQS